MSIGTLTLDKASDALNRATAATELSGASHSTLSKTLLNQDDDSPLEDDPPT